MFPELSCLQPPPTPPHPTTGRFRGMSTSELVFSWMEPGATSQGHGQPAPTIAPHLGQARGHADRPQCLTTPPPAWLPAERVWGPSVERVILCRQTRSSELPGLRPLGGLKESVRSRPPAPSKCLHTLVCMRVQEPAPCAHPGSNGSRGGSAPRPRGQPRGSAAGTASCSRPTGKPRVRHC